MSRLNVLRKETYHLLGFAKVNIVLPSPRTILFDSNISEGIKRLSMSDNYRITVTTKSGETH